MDCRDGYVQTAGWLQTSACYYLDFAAKMEELGVRNLIFTDISKDGTLSGPNFAMLDDLKLHCMYRSSDPTYYERIYTLDVDSAENFGKTILLKKITDDYEKDISSYFALLSFTFSTVSSTFAFTSFIFKLPDKHQVQRQIFRLYEFQ